MWLWKKFCSTDIIGKIYILILLFIIIVATITVVTRYNKAKSTNETVENNIYESKTSMIEQKLPENAKQKSQTINEVIDNSNYIEKEKTTETNNAPAIVTKKENESKPKENITSSKKETVKEEKKTQNKEVKEEVKKEESNTQPPKEETKQEQNYVEQEVDVAEKEECKNNKHWIATGNCQKWFNTKNEADSYYNSIIANWGKKWENDEISYEEYLKKCPSRI